MWNEYEADGDNFVPIERWGKDHWSTLAYLECRIVDHKGKINNLNMRCDSRLHREFAHPPHFGTDKKYPTRLIDGEIENHDDWSCLEDMVATGLIRAQWRQIKHNAVFSNSEAKVELTEHGLDICASLRRHKAQGGNFAGFVYSRPANYASTLTKTAAA